MAQNYLYISYLFIAILQYREQKCLMCNGPNSSYQSAALSTQKEVHVVMLRSGNTLNYSYSVKFLKFLNTFSCTWMRNTYLHTKLKCKVQQFQKQTC